MPLIIALILLRYSKNIKAAVVCDYSLYYIHNEGADYEVSSIRSIIRSILDGNDSELRAKLIAERLAHWKSISNS
jgi:hypothetical protein